MKSYDLLVHLIFEVCQQYDALDQNSEFAEAKKTMDAQHYDRVKALAIVQSAYQQLGLEPSSQELYEMVDSLLFIIKNREEVWKECKQHITIN